MATERQIGKTCPYCLTPIKPDDAVMQCARCDTPHHKDCWSANAGCATYGCKGMPVAAVGLSGSHYRDREPEHRGTIVVNLDDNRLSGPFTSTDEEKEASRGGKLAIAALCAFVLGVVFAVQGGTMAFFVGAALGAAFGSSWYDYLQRVGG